MIMVTVQVADLSH